MKETLLIVGCGDIARRALPKLLQRYRVLALLRSAERTPEGVEPVLGDLDNPDSLGTLRGLRAELLLHSAPPNSDGARDERTRKLVQALAMLPRRVAYISTSGVYGDCAGEWVDESRPVNARSGRGVRRVDAENVLRAWCPSTALLRAPGIYAADRLPLQRLRDRTPVLRAQEDVYTNHIHGDDLAQAVVRALEREVPGPFNICDDSALKMGDWFDLIADRYGLPRPPRVSREEAEAILPPTLLSFMRESRRLSNRRMKETLGVELRYPTVEAGLRDGAEN